MTSSAKENFLKIYAKKFTDPNIQHRLARIHKNLTS
jgi:hypothetical protein